MRKTLIPTAIATIALTMGLSACGSPEPEEPVDEMAMADAELGLEAPMVAVADLETAEGEPAGTVTARSEGEDVMVSVAVRNIPPGEHGVHIHMTGACEPDFSAAGGHWNPADQSHGLEDPQGQHAGDMPNLEVGEDGTGSLEYTLEGGATFEGLMDADGSAFMVHAMPDDQVTDPSGDSGDRIACGVFQADGAGAMDAGMMESEAL